MESRSDIDPHARADVEGLPINLESLSSSAMFWLGVLVDRLKLPVGASFTIESEGFTATITGAERTGEYEDNDG